MSSEEESLKKMRILFTIITVYLLHDAESTTVLDSKTTGSRWVSFWYSPSEKDLNQTLDVLRRNSDAVTSVMLYCGQAVNGEGMFVSETSEFCENDGVLLSTLRELDIGVEFVVNDGSTNVTAHKIWMQNESSVNALVSIAKEYKLTGWNLDLEPQSVPGTAEDAKMYASFLNRTRASLNEIGTRLTIDVAQWSPMLSQYDVLAPSVDRLMNMETYNCDSFEGWIKGDSYGGYYEAFVNNNIPRHVNGVGTGCWPTATCGTNHSCWTTTNSSVSPRIERMIQDNVPEIAMFRLYGDQSENTPPDERWPQDWWWGPLRDYLQK